MKKFFSVLAITVFLGGCVAGQGQKQTGGTLLGAGLGALVGSQIGGGKGKLAAVAIGALAGAYLGSEVGKSLDNADRLAMRDSTQQTFESGRSGQTVAWRNPDSGNSGTILPQPAVRDQSGGYCREYQQTITVDGRTEQAYGRACRQTDGSWKIVK